uniref:Nuclease HARBI1 n=1 Tax=Fundulus heteroclitus TaxID=8078 RepID=A0A147B4E3_FUNHE
MCGESAPLCGLALASAGFVYSDAAHVFSFFRFDRTETEKQKMVQTCCIIKCRTRSHDKLGQRKDDVKFFSFPTWKQGQGPQVSDLTRRRRMAWVEAVRRPNVTFSSIPRYMLVCSRHFHTGRPAYEMNETHPDWAPSLNLGHPAEGRAGDTEKFQRRIKKRGGAKADGEAAAPPASPPPTPDAVEDAAPAVAPRGSEQLGAAQAADRVPPLDDARCVAWKNAHGEGESTGAEVSRLLEENVTLKKELSATRMDEGFFAEADEKARDEKVKYYTGLPYWTLLQSLHTVVGPSLVEVGGKLSPFQMLLLTLMRLKLYLPQQHLAYLFHLSDAQVSEVFKETMAALHFHLAPLVHWPARRSLQQAMPDTFVEIFGSAVAVILDFFEIGTEKPSDSAAQPETCSHYAQKHTVKYLIGITPQGSIIFISKGWEGGEGRVSDKDLIKQCGILTKLSPGDLVMAERGYGDGSSLMCAEVKTPDSIRGCAQMDPKPAEDMRQIAHLRANVQRVTGLVHDKYSILQRTIPESLLDPLEGEVFPFMDKIVTVCCALTNMSPSVFLQRQDNLTLYSDGETE